MIERRPFLRAVSGVVVGTVLAGCTAADGDGTATDTATATATPTASPTDSPTPTDSQTATDSSAVVVAAGPEGRLRFDPDEIEIPPETTVRWTFESAGHNVTSLPSASEKCTNPEGAEPFASYEGTQHFSVNDPGTTFEHRFTVPGEYVYVCAPHEGQGMVGSITVTE